MCGFTLKYTQLQYVFYTALAGVNHTLEFKSQASDMAHCFVWFSSVRVI